MVHKKRRDSFLNGKISNKLSYTMISLVALILVAVIVYAAGGPYGNGVGVEPGDNPNAFSIPSPGHTLGEIAPPTGCSAGEFLKFDGTYWLCADLPGSIGGTGTANKLAKFTGASTLGNSVITDDGTNVGIGTTSPGAKLDVSGGIKATKVDATEFCFGSSCQTSWPTTPTADSLNALYNCGTVSSSLSGATGYANCAAGQIVVGGGGTCGSSNLKTSQPVDASWQITCSSSSGGTVYAICCNS